MSLDFQMSRGSNMQSGGELSHLNLSPGEKERSQKSPGLGGRGRREGGAAGSGMASRKFFWDRSGKG